MQFNHEGSFYNVKLCRYPACMCLLDITHWKCLNLLKITYNSTAVCYSRPSNSLLVGYKETTFFA